MTQETVDIVVHAYCEGCQEFIGDYELLVEPSVFDNTVIISVINKNIQRINLPFEYIKESFTPKEKAKIVISLLELIKENYDKWMDDEEDYHGDKLAERWDNDRKANLEND